MSQPLKQGDLPYFSHPPSTPTSHKGCCMLASLRSPFLPFVLVVFSLISVILSQSRRCRHILKPYHICLPSSPFLLLPSPVPCTCTHFHTTSFHLPLLPSSRTRPLVLTMPAAASTTSVKKNLSYSYLFPSYPQNKRNKM